MANRIMYYPRTKAKGLEYLYIKLPYVLGYKENLNIIPDRRNWQSRDKADTATIYTM